MRHSRIELGTPMTLRIPGSGSDGRLHNQLGGLRMHLEKPTQHGGWVVSRLNEGAGHDGCAGSRQVSQVMLVCIPTDQRQGIQHLGELGSPFNPGNELRYALGIIPGRAQESGIKRAPIHLGVVPLGDLHLAPGLLQGHVERRLIFIQPARRTGGYQPNLQLTILQSRVPEPRFISITATINITTTAAVMRPKAIPTLTSEVPRNPYRNAFTI